MSNMLKWKYGAYPFVIKHFQLNMKAQKKREMEILGLFGKEHDLSIDFSVEGETAYPIMKKYDGSNLNSVAEAGGFMTITVPLEYQMYDDISRREFEIDKSPNKRAKQVGKKLGKGARHTVYQGALDIFRNLKNTDDKRFVYGDAQPLASKSHPVASSGSVNRVCTPDTDAGTYSNLVDDVALTIDAIMDMRAAAAEYTDAAKKDFMVDHDILVIHPRLEADAIRITGNKMYKPTKDPESAENAANPICGMKYIVCSGLPVGGWGVIDSEGFKETSPCVTATEPEVTEVELENPYISRFSAYGCWSLCCAEPRYSYWSLPTSTVSA